ncbi:MULTISPECIES: sporulation transcriptional regulator SpoIIID [unclassified Lysinibacillus]|uniref:sporulation transcriptional regulator SpoIIID n=1 Tax=unclassified Lysinibacillus TaxID=2636778 RepID=UPI002011B9B5|nr:sporulation transcriptional regulator SpoIIID [Lysinibacillus sp. BPa_S21]MCL1697482.1 sporulation transcriptional regulator SpoIIID [Lysinibacillus sp. BPa_S21]MCL1699867.1 sporulation transcriptional regulator SpoIIID [Lysinibacillus sp. Bpr_S20]
MHEHIRKRCIRLGELLIETRETVRVLAKMTGYSKSTVHKDLTERLPTIHEALAEQVKEILAYHKAVRHIRGGEATKNKWKERASQE